MFTLEKWTEIGKNIMNRIYSTNIRTSMEHKYSALIVYKIAPNARYIFENMFSSIEFVMTIKLWYALLVCVCMCVCACVCLCVPTLMHACVCMALVAARCESPRRLPFSSNTGIPLITSLMQSNRTAGVKTTQWREGILNYMHKSAHPDVTVLFMFLMRLWIFYSLPPYVTPPPLPKSHWKLCKMAEDNVFFSKVTG